MLSKEALKQKVEKILADPKVPRQWLEEEKDALKRFLRDYWNNILNPRVIDHAYITILKYESIKKETERLLKFSCFCLELKVLILKFFKEIRCLDFYKYWVLVKFYDLNIYRQQLLDCSASIRKIERNELYFDVGLLLCLIKMLAVFKKKLDSSGELKAGVLRLRKKYKLSNLPLQRKK